MEVYEKINLYLKDRKISKKEFAERLIQLGVKLKNTGSVPSENTDPNVRNELRKQLDYKLKLSQNLTNSMTPKPTPF